MTLVGMTKEIDTFFADSKSLLYMSRFILGEEECLFLFLEILKRREEQRGKIVT